MLLLLMMILLLLLTRYALNTLYGNLLLLLLLGPVHYYLLRVFHVSQPCETRKDPRIEYFLRLSKR